MKWSEARCIFLSVVVDKCHLLIKMFLRFGKAGWYVVTKGRIFFRTSLFFCKADFRSVNLTSEVIFFYEIVRVTSSAKAFFEVVDVFIEGFSWGVSSQESNSFALYETFSDPVSYRKRNACIEILCRFKNVCGCQGFLGCEISFPGIDSRLKQVFVFFRPPELVNFRLKSSLETTFAQSKQICSFDDGDTHTRSIDLVGVEAAHSRGTFCHRLAIWKV